MIIAAGREVACAAPVVPWHDHGLHFGGLGQRSSTTAVVLHHTGGIGLAPQVFRTLVQRRLSVHFCVEPNGTVYQFCDASARCAHAGSVDDSNDDGIRVSGNSTTIGVELVNPASRAPATKGIVRPMVTETIHGQTATVTGFTEAQVESASSLCRALCAAYGLPLAVPMAGDHVLATTLSEADWVRFRGVCGHLHLTQRKRDPGLAVFGALIAASSPRTRA